MLESSFQSRFLSWLRLQRHVYVEKSVASTTSGGSDAKACIGGRYVALEFKRDGEMLEPLQAHKGGKVMAAGGLFWMVCPSNAEKIKEKILAMNDVWP